MDNRPKILFVMPLPPPVHGAAVVGGMISGSEEIDSRFRCDYVNSSTSASLKDVGKVGVWKLFSAVSLYVKVLRKLIGTRYDICCLALTCHGVGFLKDAPVALLCKAFGHEVVIHQHNKGMSADLDRWPYRFLLRMVYRDSGVILLSERLYPDIEKVVSHDQVMICPNGIGSPLQTVHRDHDVPCILFLSNLIVSKGIIVLLDACRRLRCRGVEFRCVFAGAASRDMSEDAFRTQVHEHGLDEVVTYAGPLYGEAKHEALDKADIFAFPSLNEAFGLVLLEAMQHGLPAVSTYEGGIPDIVIDGETGYLVPKNDPEALAERLQCLIERPEMRQEMGRAGRKLYEERFTREKFIGRFIGCIQSALEK